MSSLDFEHALDEALRLRSAGWTVSACLERFPEHAEALKPLLETADAVSLALFADKPVPKPDLARGRSRVLQAARSAGRRRASLPLGRWATALAFVLIVVFGTGAASAQALPGDWLYPVKRGLEAARLALAVDDTTRLQIDAEQNERRRQELVELARLGREGVVEFEGSVEAVTGTTLVVDGVPIEGSTRAAAGDQVRVRVRTASGELVLEELSPVAAPAPTETPDPTSVRLPTTAPLPTDTRPAPTDSDSTRPAVIPSTRDAATITPEPTREPSATPTVAATLEPTRRPDRATPTGAATELSSTREPERASPTSEPTQPQRDPSPTPGRVRP